MKSLGYRSIYSLLLVFTVALGSSNLKADTITVAVAANFTSTLQRIETAFTQQTGHQLVLVSGSSGSHYTQIINGAPFDLFLSADSARPQALEEAGLISPAQRRVYALGRLALWSRDPVTASSLEALNRVTAGKRVAIANPRLAPYGQAAVEALHYLGLYDRLQASLVMGQNVGQAFQFAYSGSASLGIVAYAQVLAAPESGSFTLFPDKAYQPIVQEMVLLRETGATVALFEYLSSTAVSTTLEAAGYYAPQIH